MFPWMMIANILILIPVFLPCQTEAKLTGIFQKKMFVLFQSIVSVFSMHRRRGTMSDAI